MSAHKNGLGKTIPDDHFENEAGPPRDPKQFMSPEAIAREEEWLRKARAERDMILKARRGHS